MQTAFALNHAPTYSLDDLQRFTYPELEQMYRAAQAPASVRSADGKLRGRMLAWRSLEHGAVARWLRKLALSPTFLWSGKNFWAGGGVNRICVPGLIGRQELFPFTSSIGPSLFDGWPTLRIDYDRPDNPWFMRRIHDEIRELEPGLFLGLDLWKTPEKSIGLVWFALDQRRGAISEK
jgi:hypothetical protein